MAGILVKKKQLSTYLKLCTSTYEKKAFECAGLEKYIISVEMSQLCFSMS